MASMPWLLKPMRLMMPWCSGRRGRGAAAGCRAAVWAWPCRFRGNRSRVRPMRLCIRRFIEVRQPVRPDWAGWCPWVWRAWCGCRKSGSKPSLYTLLSASRGWNGGLFGIEFEQPATRLGRTWVSFGWWPNRRFYPKLIACERSSETCFRFQATFLFILAVFCSTQSISASASCPIASRRVRRWACQSVATGGRQAFHRFARFFRQLHNMPFCSAMTSAVRQGQRTRWKVVFHRRGRLLDAATQDNVDDFFCVRMSVGRATPEKRIRLRRVRRRRCVRRWPSNAVWIFACHWAMLWLAEAAAVWTTG